MVNQVMYHVHTLAETNDLTSILLNIIIETNLINLHLAYLSNYT